MGIIIVSPGGQRSRVNYITKSIIVVCCVLSVFLIVTRLHPQRPIAVIDIDTFKFADHVPASTRAVARSGAPERLILHYVRFKPDDANNISLGFTDYLSIQSAAQRLKPDQILLHGDVEPIGTSTTPSLTTSGVKHVTTRGVKHVTTSDINHVTTSGVKHVTTSDVNHVTTSDVNHVITSDINHAITSHVNHVTTSDVNHVTTGHVPVNNPTQIIIFRNWKYWSDLRNRSVKFVYREKNFTLKGRIKKLEQIFHVADRTKLDILLEYGGLVADFDVYFVRGERIRRILNAHPVMTCYGDEIGYSIGLVGGWKSSRLIHAWRRSYDVIYSKDWNFNSGDLQKYLSEIFSDEVYVVDQVCNNPHPDGHLDPFFKEHGKVHWTDSVAIHTFHSHSGIEPVREPEDLYKGTPTDYKDLLLMVYENRNLPHGNPNFKDRIDPLKGTLL
ncbi:hypothetical protein BV898_01694 [Hypsibius exemplaris]|uniref:Uncharacterized protein n=1 Tax=Hypsibius exemplaris TaxID=2072580 RepID=A0A1W0XAT6_HYPEX|nr:hypothetical protein BV898_01694 [Hypsibius exemplaris]